MLRLVRVWIPIIGVAAGLLVIALGGATVASLETGIPILSAGASVWLLNFLHRIGVDGDVDRDTEADARRYFAEHGRWPDEPTRAA